MCQRRLARMNTLTLKKNSKIWKELFQHLWETNVPLMEKLGDMVEVQ